jgi:hypothetical protein
MVDAHLRDHNAIKTKNGPAIHRIMLLKEVELMLKKKVAQEEFIALGGLDVLAHWISLNPDGSCPLPQVVESVFEILDMLPIISE